MDKNALVFNKFMAWAGKAGYDTAYTCDSTTGHFIVFNPATKDAWQAWCAGWSSAKSCEVKQ